MTNGEWGPGAGSDAGARAGALPNLIVIGAAKSGTTSLHRYLDLHPDIAMAREKELHFFVEGKAWERGVDWYRKQFDASAPFRGESSVSYAAYPRDAGIPARMHALIPDAKLLYILRDPIERIVSAYVHRYSDGIETRPIGEALSELEGNDLVERSRYHYQLEQYLAFYPLSAIHIVTLERLRSEAATVMKEVYSFLGADPDFRSPEMTTVWNPTSIKRKKGPVALALQWLSKTRPAQVFSPHVRQRIGLVLYHPFSRPIDRPRIDAVTRDRLVEYLAPDVAKLRALTGQAFSEWSV